MFIETQLEVNRLSVQPGNRIAGPTPGWSKNFAAFLAEQATIDSETFGLSAAPAAETKTSETKGRYTGFFKKLQEEQMEKLREKILQEMGLTEESLAKMDPEARARVEAMIAKEMAKRILAQSAMEKDGQEKNGKMALMIEGIEFF